MNDERRRPRLAPPVAQAPASPRRALVLAILAAAMAALFALLLAWRPLTSFDLGYHVTYGDVFWNTGHVVGDATFLAPPPTAEEAHADLPPEARYKNGHYTFPNSNWLSQAIMSVAFRVAGPGGLGLLTLLAIAVILAAQAQAVRTVTNTWVWAGPVWLATAITGYERFYLRPELLGNACLVGQFALLLRPLSRRTAIAFLALQLVAVSAHSYWLLGAGLAGATAMEAGIEALRRRRPGNAAPAGRNTELRMLLALCLAALALGIAHPAGFRNLVLPLKTLSYMHLHHIGGSTPDGVRALWQKGEFHPWQDTGELFRTLSPGAMGMRSTRGFIALLALAAPAALILFRRGRFGLAVIALALTLVALPVRRNVATAAFIVWPLIAIGAHLIWQHGAAARRSALRLVPSIGLGAVTLAALYWIPAVVTSRFYLSEGREARFGSGISRAVLPVGTCEWLDANLDLAQPVFTNFNASSAVLFLSRQVTAVPILTNAWAYPPSRKTRLLKMQSGDEWIDPFAHDAGLDIAVFYALPSIRPLLSRLATAPDWVPVHLEGAYVVFARRTPANANLIAAHALVPDRLDLPALITRARALDPKGGWALRNMAGALTALGWDAQAQAALAALAVPDFR